MLRSLMNRLLTVKRILNGEMPMDDLWVMSEAASLSS